jgi:uncharacterized phage protein (TIGR02218 family)
MTYSTYEDSLELGTPIELYEFVQGTSRWYYISGANSITRLSRVYAPLPVERDRIKQTSDIFKDSLKLTFPRSNEFAVQYIGFAPEEVTTVTVLRGHYGDPDGEFIVYWKGRVIGAKASGNVIDIECESIFTSIKRPGLRARFELGCRHTLYLSGCNVNRELYKHEGAILSIGNGVNITVNGAALQADGFYTGGMLLAPSGVARFITAHASDIVTISRPLPELVGGMTVVIYPGCDHLATTCLNKFNNLDNFGGFPYIPTRNPFNGSSIV